MINVGIIGFGTVGSGTAKILLENKVLIRDRTGVEVRLKRIADLDIETDRGIDLPKDVLTNNVRHIIDDPEIDIVVELIGGIQPAKGFMLEALQNGKSVVTANKALLAESGMEIFQAAENNGRILAFEAAVAGGIPIIKVLKEGLASNKILSIYGIINGTSNYILSKMSKEGIDFNDALKEAQSLGYAEADPTFDIEGIDSAHKLTLMSSLAYGIPLMYEKVYKEGITKITSQDIALARELGYKIKSLAITKVTESSIEMRVHPTMIPDDYLISRVDGVFNAIHVIGDAVGESLYYGRGAGDMPTGSAVVSDIIDIAGHMEQSDKDVKKGYCPMALEELTKENNYSIREMKDIESMYYFRFTALDQPGVLSKISGVLGDHNISISAVIQKERKEGEGVPVVVLAHKAKEQDVMKALDKINNLSSITEKTMFIRVEGTD